MRFLSTLCALIWAVASANEFIPKVTKSTVKGSQEFDDFDYPDIARFGDSDTLILTFGGRLHISFDDGEHWETVSGIESTDIEISIDKFHPERAFVITGSEKTEDIYVTEDEGKNWRKFFLTEDTEFDEMNCFPVTHPFDKNLLLLNCHIMHENRNSFGVERFGGKIFYGSEDAGNSFRRIVGSGPSDFRTTCTFAASKESVVKDNGIYCIETIEKSEGGVEILSSNQRTIRSGETSFHQQRKSVGTLFYTTDLGKTKKTFDELSGFSVGRIFILPSCVAVTTSDSNDSRNPPSKLWVSKGTSFKAANLPEGVLPLYVQNHHGNDQGLLSLRARVQDSGDPWGSMRLLISDSSGLNFSFQEPIPHSKGNHIRHSRQIGNLKGTLLGMVRLEDDNDAEEKGNWLQKVVGLLKNLFSITPAPAYTTKGSFDNGKTWTNLKIVDPSRRHRHHLRCNIDNVEHCSFQGFPLDTEEPATGIIIGRGVAGEKVSGCLKNAMTFISRDGGVSWEVAFESLVETAILDFGNVIVAMPIENTSDTHEYVDIADYFDYIQTFIYRKFYFSLDQGRSWGVYHFEEPIHAWEGAELESRGLKANIRFTRKLENSKEYVSYSVDFSNAFDGTACTENDWERWYLSKGNCIDGERYSFNRRKPDSECLMRKTFDELQLHEEKCG